MMQVWLSRNGGAPPRLYPTLHLFICCFWTGLYHGRTNTQSLHYKRMLPDTFGLALQMSVEPNAVQSWMQKVDAKQYLV